MVYGPRWMGVMNMTAIGEWVDYECPECGTWFPVDERRCPTCCTKSIWKMDQDELIDEIVDELMEESESPPESPEDIEEEEAAERPGKGTLMRRKLRSMFK
jgi:hypothetical protein